MSDELELVDGLLAVLLIGCEDYGGEGGLVDGVGVVLAFQAEPELFVVGFAIGAL